MAAIHLNQLECSQARRHLRMPGACWQRQILATVNEALGNVERVKGLEIQFLHVRLVWRRSILLPESPCHLLRGVLDETVSPNFIWKQSRVIGASLCKLLE